MCWCALLPALPGFLVRGAGATGCVRRGYPGALMARDSLAEAGAGVCKGTRDCGGRVGWSDNVHGGRRTYRGAQGTR
ncbi:hypothetical protein B0H13DRAFT_2040994 [Mycena leptocephala]|nr:hypothetical protein B0H13DRAFT_2040994 [Mycena leptocephala]